MFCIGHTNSTTFYSDLQHTVMECDLCIIRKLGHLEAWIVSRLFFSNFCRESISNKDRFRNLHNYGANSPPPFFICNLFGLDSYFNSTPILLQLWDKSQKWWGLSCSFPYHNGFVNKIVVWVTMQLLNIFSMRRGNQNTDFVSYSRLD